MIDSFRAGHDVGDNVRHHTGGENTEYEYELNRHKRRLEVRRWPDVVNDGWGEVERLLMLRHLTQRHCPQSFQ